MSEAKDKPISFVDFMTGLVEDYGKYIDGETVVLKDGRMISLIQFERGYGLHLISARRTASGMGLSREAVAALGQLIFSLPRERQEPDIAALQETWADDAYIDEHMPDVKRTAPEIGNNLLMTLLGGDSGRKDE